MRISNTFGVIAFALSAIPEASSWSFEDASVSVSGKGTDGAKHILSSESPLARAVTLTSSNSIKVVLTTTDEGTGKKPHQAFLTLQESESGLEESFAFGIKDSGKGKVDVSAKDLPSQFLTSNKPLRASVVVASFGSSKPYNAHAFDITVVNDATVPPPSPAAPERYTAKPEIHHIFNADPRSPPKIISLFFTLAVLGALPALFGGWLLLGGNITHASKAFGASPVAHSLFFGSILAMEGVFFLYYSAWNLFQTLPAAAVVSVVLYVSGSRALTEVQERRLAGER